MGIEAAGDAGVFFSVDDFAEVARVVTGAGAAFDVPGIFNAPFVGVADFEGIEAASSDPTFRCDAVAAELVAVRDRLTVRGVEYSVRSKQLERDGRQVVLRLGQ